MREDLMKSPLPHDVHGNAIHEAVATTNLVRSLEKKCGLKAAEVSSVLGTSMVYDVAEVVDPQEHVVARVAKSVLAGLKPAK